MTGDKPVRTIVYVGNAETNDIHVYQLYGASGDLVLVEKVAIPGVLQAGISTPLAIRPDKRFLFAGMRGEPTFAATFTINPENGRLAYVASGPLADRMAYIATDRTGRFLLSASYTGHKVAVNPIGSDGSVQPPMQIVPTEPHAHAILPDPANRYVLVTSLGGDLIKQFKFDAATGRLSPNEPTATRLKEKAGPRHFVFHPNGHRVYLLNELDASVCVFDYDPLRGHLEQRQTVSALPFDFTGQPAAADLHLTPDGRFLYASVRASNTLSAFTVEPDTGTLAPIGSTPTEEQPRGFNIDPSGRYLLAVGQRSHRMSSYRIDPGSGVLTRLKRYPTGRNPNWVEIITLP